MAITKSDEGGRQVQDSGDSKPFLRLALGRKSKTDLAVRVIGWRSGDGPEFFRFYNGKIPELLLGNTITQQADECPLPSTPREAPIDLGFDSFEGLSLIKDGSDWRLLVEARADEAISKLFGGGAVTFKIGKIQPAEDGDSVQLETSVAIKISKTVTVSGTINFSFNLTDLSVRIEEGVSLGLDIEFKNDVPQWATTLGLIGGGDNYLFSDPITILDGLELTGIIEKPDDPKLTKFSIFEAALEDGRFVLRVPDNADIVLRNDDVGEGLTFQISELEIGPSGLDLTAALVATKLKLPGLKKEFLLEHAGLRIVDGKMQNICITGSGQLPELLNEAPVKISLALKQNAAGRIVMSDFDCTLGNGKSSIISRGTRFKFDLTQITIGIDNANGTAQPVWRFLISGSMSFVPNGAEFLGGALENLQSATLEFVNAPLGDEFFKHIEFSVALVKPYSFPVFGLFDMEIRSIGFHPAFGPFGEKPAIIIGGQVKFADVGDAVSADITFHKMYIGFPKQGEILPQFHFKGLRIEIAASGFKIAGEVQHIDNAKMKGFAGFGTIMIPGMPELTAAFAFTKLRAAETDSWKRGWFIALEASRISFQMGPLPLYLRQIGLGFGYRYTSVIIKRFEEEDRLGPLVALMKKEVNNHQTLANLNSWAPDAERDGARGRWSIGIEAVFSMTSANSGPFTYEEKAEEQMRSFVAQMLIFLRSDLTFLAAAKVWFPISADDFFKNKYDMRRRPLGLGFMIYSAPKKRLLIHVAKGKNPYLGPPGKPVPDIVKNVLDQSHFEATFLSEPGLLHAELGWPDRLFFKFELGGLTLECRGGVLFRAERGMLVQGIYFSATGNADMGGGLSIGIVGVRVSAKINVSLAMRQMIGINLTKPLQSTIYAVVGFAVTVHFSIHAWFRLNLRFCKISIDLYFPLDLQITVLVELGWAGGTNLGFRIRATLMISIFGRGLHVKVALAVRPDDVNQARIRMEPYMRSYMEPGAIPPIPGLTTQENIQGLRQREKAELIRSDALLSIPRATDSALESYMLDDSPDTVSPVGITPMPPTAKQNTQHIDYDFALAMSRGQTKTRSGERLWFGWIIPSPKTPAFYPIQNEANATYAQLSYTQNKRAKIYQPVLDNKTLRWVPANGTVSMAANLDSKTELKNEDGTPYSGGSLTLRNQLAWCHIPVKEKHYRNGDSEPFPQNIAKNTPIMAPPAEFVGVLRDDRLDTPGSDAQNPRRQLERNRHKFDDLLLDSIGQRSLDDTGDAFGEKTNFAEKAKRQLTDQARGTQSYLLRAFADDLKRIIETTGLSEDGKPLATSFDGLGRPTIADLGLVFCVVAEECPDWLLSPLTANPAKLKFTEIQQIDEKDSKYNNNDQIIRPVIDFEKIDFELSPPSLSGKTRSHMDDDSLHFGWDLDWGVRGRPVNSENEPTDFTIEDFLLGYEIIITRAGQREPVDHVVVGPADLLVGLTKDKRIENNGADKIRLKGAYQYNRQLEEIGIDISREFSTELNLTAHITPISQDGTTGQPFSITTTHRPSTRPLPPDDVKLELMLRKKAAMKDNGKGKSEKLPVGLSGQITWRVLALPDSALVARTARWDLILRPIDQLPPGAYPAEATDPDDAVLSGPEGVKLLDGDLIVVLPDSMLSKSSQQDVATSNQSTEQKDPETAERDPALYTISVSLPQPSFNYEVYDHNGQQLPQKDPRRAKALKFFSGQVSNTKDGAGWHLFLRSSAELAPKAGDTFLEDRAVSALVRVQMSLRSDKTDQNIATGIRPLQHLEWVKKPVPLAQVEKSWIDSDQGPLHHAAMEIVDVAGIPKWRISYLPRPGTDRVVTIRWSASTSNKVPVTDIASFHVHETRLDSLLNADVPAATDQKNPVPPDGFGSVWQEIREVRPVDPADAGRAVSDFAKPETWDRLPPVQAATIRWLTAQKVPQADMKAKSPGWYSWADSELAWVPANRRFADDLAKINDALTQPPQEYVLVSHSSDKPSALMISLSARYELGAYYARRKLHPWMQIVIGTLAMSGLPQHADNTGNEYARFEIEISQPKSPPRKNDGTLPDLAEWMQGDSAEADPLGWAALAKMGLATGISLRDPWTGDYLPQSEVRDFLNNAIKQTYKDVAYAEAILRVDSDIKIEIEIENKSNPNINDSVILSGHGTKAEMLNPDPDFLSLDVPLQAAWAVQAQPGKTDHDSLRALSMLQLSLRPYAIEMTPRSSLELGSDAEKFASPDEANYLTVEFDPKDKSAPKNEPNPKNEPGLEEDDLLPDADLQILNFGHVKGDGNKSTLMHYKKTAKENPKLDSLVNAGDRIIICHRHWSDDPSTSADWVFRKLFGKAYHEDAETDFGYFGKIGMKFELYKGLSKEPLFLLKNANQDDLRKSPWGRFSSKIFWTQYFFAPRGPDENGKNPDKHAPFLNIDGKEVDTTHLMFDRFMTHLTTAFAGEGGNEEPAAPDQSAEALRRKAYEKSTDLVEAYILWADRFFSSGPAIKRKSPETGSIIHTGQSPVHLTTVWPQRETPVRMAPDAMGRMQITHYINEDWASARSYAISRRHRWDDFFTPEDPVVFPKLDGKSGRTDIAIPRRRALQPAKLIGLRIIQSQSGQPFHEITLSEPSDLTLSKSNVTLARKLEFEALLRQFRLSFRHTKWATQLGITDARFPTGKDEDDTDVPDIAVEDAASDYLADTPRARLGAIRYQTPAEPYYYDQEMWHLTTATHVRSSESQIILPPPPAVAPQPVAGMGDAMKSFDVKWKDIDLPSQSFLSNNADKIKTTALSDNLQDFLQPQAQKFTLRMPRLLEALPEASHQGYQSAEIEEKSFGRIPDPSARLEIVDSGNGMRTTIATLVTIIAPNGGPQEPLELLTASNRHA
ncbi:MAG: hypothetical protein JKY45_10125, partial [Emcibacter sp.]|nr:hypothetical protein [Emcibacter sp.]